MYKMCSGSTRPIKLLDANLQNIVPSKDFMPEHIHRTKRLCEVIDT